MQKKKFNSTKSKKALPDEEIFIRRWITHCLRNLFAIDQNGSNRLRNYARMNWLTDRLQMPGRGQRERVPANREWIIPEQITIKHSIRLRISLCPNWFYIWNLLSLIVVTLTWFLPIVMWFIFWTFSWYSNDLAISFFFGTKWVQFSYFWIDKICWI